jgi:DNA-binding SARP family transcriptional activator
VQATVSHPLGTSLQRQSPAPGTAARLRLQLEGGFSLWGGGKPWQVPLAAQRVLAFLALEDRPRRRSRVAGELWPGSDEVHAAASLRSVLWRLKRPGPSPIAACGDDLRLVPDVSVDVRETRAAAERVLSPKASVTAGDLDTLVQSTEVLPDWYDDWLLIEREQLREQRVRALEQLCGELTSAARFAEAARVALSAIAADPLRESAHRALIRLHIAEGNESEALQRYAGYRALLERKLGITPSTRMEELMGELSAKRLRNLATVSARPPR